MFRIVRKELSDGVRFDAQRDNGDILGSAFVGLTEDRVVLDLIQTNLGEREKGIGGALLAAVIDWGRLQGVERLTGDFAPDCTINPAKLMGWYWKRGIEVDGNGKLVGEVK